MKQKKGFDLARHAVLVRLSTGYWQGKCPAGDIASEMEAKYGAEAGSFDASKYVIDRDVWLVGQRICKKAGKWFRDNTLPWGDGGLRLVRCDRLPYVQDTLTSFQNQIVDHRDEMLAQYGELYERAKQRLNGAFKEKDFPTPETLAGKYHMDWTVMPIADADDIRLQGYSDSELEDLRKEVRGTYDAMLAEGMRDLMARVQKVVQHMVASLKGKAPDGKKQKVFRDTLVGNVEEVCNVLPSVMLPEMEGAAELGKLVKKMKEDLTTVSPDALRKNQKVKKELTKKAEGILAELSNFKV